MSRHNNLYLRDKAKRGRSTQMEPKTEEYYERLAKRLEKDKEEQK